MVVSSGTGISIARLVVRFHQLRRRAGTRHARPVAHWPHLDGRQGRCLLAEQGRLVFGWPRSVNQPGTGLAFLPSAAPLPVSHGLPLALVPQNDWRAGGRCCCCGCAGCCCCGTPPGRSHGERPSRRATIRWIGQSLYRAARRPGIAMLRCAASRRATARFRRCGARPPHTA
jgi:hypothetical protein